MGKKMDKVLSIGGSIASVVGLYDRFDAWRVRRSERLAEAARKKEFKRASRTAHELNRMSDGAAELRGAGRCSRTTSCARPNFHPGDCGPKLKPWKETT
jgi:hypothetical protein